MIVCFIRPFNPHPNPSPSERGLLNPLPRRGQGEDVKLIITNGKIKSVSGSNI
jgi:hypothetical protein